MINFRVSTFLCAVMVLSCIPEGDGNTASASEGTTVGISITLSDGETLNFPTTSGNLPDTSTSEVGGSTEASSSGTTHPGPEDPWPCDPFLQDCPRGEKCLAYDDEGGNTWNHLKCVPVIPEPDSIGQECEGSANLEVPDTCEKGAMCWNVNLNTGKGTCVALCTGSFSDTKCADGFSCVLANYNVLNLCLPTCDPLDEFSCPSNNVCIYSWEDTSEFVCVSETENKQVFEPCEYLNQCALGLLCLPNIHAQECNEPNETQCCLPFCDLDQPICPGEGQECIPWFEKDEPIPVGLEDVGICMLP